MSPSQGLPWRNWARSVTATPVEVRRPTGVEGVVEAIDDARRRGLVVKAVGAGHSFADIAATAGVQLDLAALDGLLHVDPVTRRATFGAGTNLYQVTALLQPHGLGLENMGDIDRQTIAGATQTGTHGTGARFAGMASRITGLTLVTADGRVLRIDETENADLLPAARIGLGALGILVDVTIQCVPAFLLHAVEHPEPFDAVLDDFATRAARADHFEFYWWPHTDRVMTKTNTRLPVNEPRRPVGPLAAWVEDRLLANGALALMCTLGRMAPGLTPPLNRLATRVYGDREYTDRSAEVFTSPRTTRFRELEYALPRAAVPQALRDIRGLIEHRNWRISFPIEVRVAAPDDTWLSTAYGRDTGYIAVHRHFRDGGADYFDAVDALLRSYDGRPHWGKIHFQQVADLRPRYPRFGDFLAVRDRLDPGRLFTNPYLDRVLGA